ncbi:MAG: glycosyltransferase family 4 protein [Anaerolineales bacterium]
MRILALMRLTPIKVRDHLSPLIDHPGLEALILVRYDEASTLQSPKVTQVTQRRAVPDGPVDDRFPQNLLRSLRVFWMGFQATRRYRPEAIYAIHLVPYGLFAWVLARLFRRKLIITLIGGDFNKDLQEYRTRGFWRWLLRQADAVTTFDEGSRQTIIGFGCAPERVFVLPHAVEMARFVPGPAEDKDITVIYTGHLWALKENWRLLNAWPLVLAAHPGSRLAIVGDGPERANLEAQAAELGIRDAVQFVGWASDVAPWLQRARVFVNVSNQEGVPMAMLEAMACGLVPVVTDVGGVGSIIQDGENGLLLPSPADPAQIAARINALLADPAKWARMSAAAEAVRAQFDYPAVSATWSPILQHLTEDSAPRSRA